MERRAFGTWSSSLDAARVAQAGVRFGQPAGFRGDRFWIEGRPDEGGRQVLVRSDAGGGISDVVPGDVNVRSTVHEYGGGDYAVCAHGIALAAPEGGASWLEGLGTGTPSALPGARRDARYADFAISPDGEVVMCVEETHHDDREPTNQLVALHRSTGRRVVVEAAHDFVSSPVFSPRGDRLAYLVWDHPRMPWQGTELKACALTQREFGSARSVAGGERESIFQPAFSPDGTLFFVSDRSGWWNLYAMRGDRAEALAPRRAEFGRPQWVFGMQTYGFAANGEVICRVGQGGRSSLMRVHAETGAATEIPLPFSSIDGVAVSEMEVILVAASERENSTVAVLDLETGALSRLRGGGAGLSEETISVADPRTFATSGGESAHGFFYAPRSDRWLGPEGASPPLLVRTHGGPTSASGAALDSSIQFFTSRGFAVFDVNYRGSTGYGRAYWEALGGQWGVLDVDDCEAAAADAVARGEADPSRLAIRGGSAGGYTTLCALAFGTAFHAGASYYGIGDLSLLAEDTHKFESHYTDWLIGPYPEARALYRERSPLHAADKLTCPVIFFQGMRDRVVPPNQAETMVAALRDTGIHCEHVTFAEEGHGFRRADTIVACLERELAFYRHVFGLTGKA